MYEKNLSKDMHLRVSDKDMEFLENLAKEREVSISEVIRTMIGEYRRSLETVSVLQETIKLLKDKNGGELSNGDVKTNLNDKL